MTTFSIAAGRVSAAGLAASNPLSAAHLIVSQVERRVEIGVSSPGDVSVGARIEAVASAMARLICRGQSW